MAVYASFNSFIVLGTLIFGTAFGFSNFTKYEQLTKEWSECGFPPKDVYNYNTTDLLKVCGNDDALSEVRLLCNLFLDFTEYECQYYTQKELMKISGEISVFFNTKQDFFLCDDNLGVQIPAGIKSMFQGDVCRKACSERQAEHVCRLIVIFALTDYNNFDAVVKQSQFGIQKTAPKPATHPTTIKPNESSNATQQPIANNETTSEQNETATTNPKPNDKTSHKKQPIKTTPLPPKLLKENGGKITLTYGALAIYGIMFILVCGGLYLIFRFRHSILSCLRENQESTSVTEDGKGSYRKVPAFEKILPSLDDKVKAKSFIY